MDKQRDFHLHDGKIGSAITVRVTQKASRSEVSEILNDGTIRIRLTTSQLDKVDNELVKFLSEILEIPAIYIEIIAGRSERDKIITINHLTSDIVQERILRNMA